MSSIRIFYAYDAKIGNDAQQEEMKRCQSLFSDVFSCLKHKFDALGDAFASDGFESAKGKEDFDLVAGAPSFLKEMMDRKKDFSRPLPAILFLSDDVWGEATGDVLSSVNFDVRGVFLASRLWPEDKRDVEDFASLVSVMKGLVRQILRSRRDKDGRPLLHEEDISKRVNWKVTVKNRKDSGFISLFSDPSVQGMAREYKEALRNLKRPILDELRKFKRFEELSPRGEADGRLKKYQEEIEASLGKRVVEEGTRVPSLLLLGETGCGKSLLARASADVLSDNKFFRANISAYPESSIDGFLFGAVRGSYTGSEKDAPGVFIAHCGETVFLDEIGDMSAESQTRLLTYMDDGKVTPLGMNRPILAPCILIAATNKPIDDKSSSDFRQDIVHRFDHIIKIPPLRERKQDLRFLISLTLQDEAINPVVGSVEDATARRRVGRISLDAIKYLEGYDFPGNYRELEFILRQAVNNAFAEGSTCLCVRHIRPVP